MNDYPARPIIIGVMGSHEHDPATATLAEETGRQIARRGHILLTGGGPGLMRAASKGAASAGGLVVGILPTDAAHPAAGYPNEYVTIPIYTGMGEARNVINVKSCRAIIALAGGPGTLSEIALAIRANTPIIALNAWHDLFPGRIVPVTSVADAMAALDRILAMTRP